MVVKPQKINLLQFQFVIVQIMTDATNHGGYDRKYYNRSFPVFRVFPVFLILAHTRNALRSTVIARCRVYSDVIERNSGTDTKCQNRCRWQRRNVLFMYEFGSHFWLSSHIGLVIASASVCCVSRHRAVSRN